MNANKIDFNQLDRSNSLYDQKLVTHATGGTASITLPKGKYIVLLNYSMSQSDTGVSSNVTDWTEKVSCSSSDCIVKNLSGRYYKKSGTEGLDVAKCTNYKYILNHVYASLLYVEVRGNSASISKGANSGSIAHVLIIIGIQAVPIG